MLRTLSPKSCALAVMTKAPFVGNVKTRLTPPLTSSEAAEINRCFLQDILATISDTVVKGTATGVAVYTPLGSEAAYEGILPDGFQLIPQRGEVLEERLVFATDDLFQLGFESVCLINSDSPTIPERAFAEAIEVLTRPEEQLVLGPSSDGGYYLIGTRKLYRSLFEEISWSTEHVLRQTLERARQMNLDVHLLPAWYDVDDRETLSRLCDELFAQEAGAECLGSAALATRRFLETLLRKERQDPIWNRAWASGGAEKAERPAPIAQYPNSKSQTPNRSPDPH